jgi:hypothetical protein
MVHKREFKNGDLVLYEGRVYRFDRVSAHKPRSKVWIETIVDKKKIRLY